MSSSKSNTEKSTNRSESSPTTQQVATAAHEALDRAAAHLEDAETRIRDHVTQARDTLDTNSVEAQRWVQDQGARLQRTVRQNPFTSLAVAFAAGLVVARVLKRR
ncbi:MAG: hypothetical protein KDK91_24335 [Gammaproteobacteria bacterium]|nr:hypothetical protein [Gammaproteobacteria bacterium]